MHFFKTSIQLRLIPAVMADRVNAASCVCTTKERREKSLKLRDGSQKSKHLEEVVTHLSHDNRLKRRGTERFVYSRRIKCSPLSKYHFLGVHTANI